MPSHVPARKLKRVIRSGAAFIVPDVQLIVLAADRPVAIRQPRGTDRPLDASPARFCPRRGVYMCSWSVTHDFLLTYAIVSHGSLRPLPKCGVASKRSRVLSSSRRRATEVRRGARGDDDQGNDRAQKRDEQARSAEVVLIDGRGSDERAHEPSARTAAADTTPREPPGLFVGAHTTVSRRSRHGWKDKWRAKQGTDLRICWLRHRLHGRTAPFGWSCLYGTAQRDGG